jgi:hypothetical protein
MPPKATGAAARTHDRRFAGFAASRDHRLTTDPALGRVDRRATGARVAARDGLRVATGATGRERRGIARATSTVSDLSQMVRV